MFFKREESRRKRSFFPLTILRLFLSIIMFLILGIGVIQAFRYFSGVDPLKIDPQSFVSNLFTTENLVETVSTVLGVTLPIKPDSSKVIEQSSSEGYPGDAAIEGADETAPSERRLILKFAVVSDSHNDNDNLAKALATAKQEGAKFVVGLGDYSQVGTIGELEAAKKVFESANLPYYLTAGDHDLWDSRDKGYASSNNFNQLFRSTYKTFSDTNIRFVIVYNSDNYEGVDAQQMGWLKDVMKKTAEDKPVQSFVFTHEPLYHPSSDRVMGKTDKALKRQAQEIIRLLGEYKVGEVFAGDIHAYTRYQEPEAGLSMTTAGAVTSERNLQLPRFLLVDVYSDGSYNIEDREINR